MNELALFAGAGGGILGGHLLGWRTICAVEFDPYARDVLLARQNDGCLPPFPVWDDVRTFDGRPWRGSVDVVSGGFPCQDISAAGKGAGIGGERSGLWSEMARIVGEVQPRFVWVENSPMLVGRGLGLVLLDLAAMGFSARWGVVGACDAGAPYQRDRIWIAAFSNSACWGDWGEHAQPDFGHCGGVAGTGADVRHAEEQGLERPESAGNPRAGGCLAEHGPGRRQAGWWESEPDVGRVAHGVAARVDRLRCTGNGQVPGVAAMAWRILSMPTLPVSGRR
ncbi:MAG TPA: DNA cytosine methyltransferase [bacterium]|nr:DNA cytosine methyltransferase [bacterium]